MPMKSVPWNPSEYHCLTPDLAGPSAMQDRLESQIRLRGLLDSVARLTASGPSGVSLRDEIESRILMKVQENQSNDSRQLMMRNAVERYRSERKKILQVPGVLGDAGLKVAVQAVCDAYFAFNIEKWRADFDAVYAKELAENSVFRELERANEQIEEIRANDRWKVGIARRFFNGGAVPAMWRDFRADLMGEVQMAETITKLFLKEWRARAPYFLEPVTVTGVLIRSLPDCLRETWLKLYQRLGLGDIPKRVTYEPLVSKLPTDDVPGQSTLPGKFSRASE